MARPKGVDVHLLRRKLLLHVAEYLDATPLQERSPAMLTACAGTVKSLADPFAREETVRATARRMRGSGNPALPFPAPDDGPTAAGDNVRELYL